MVIGIIGAMNIEVNTLKTLIKNPTISNFAGIEFVKGELQNKEVIVAKCGVGKVFAALCTQIMIDKFSPDLIINTGVAGAVSESLKICDIAIGKNAIQYDVDTSAIGDPVGLISGINLIHIPCDMDYVNIIEQCADKLKMNHLTGTIASADRFQNKLQEKEMLKQKYGAIACEMESGSIAQVCYVNNVKAVIIRAISDTSNDSSHIEYMEFLSRASTQSINLVLEFLNNI